VELEDEAPIRRIFSESYRDLVDNHASIRKMVRSALASDLSFSPSTAKSSCIHSYYKSRGGFFLVALFAGGGADSPNQRRKVLGGIAVRRIGLAEFRARKFSHDASVVFEIHRLVVDSSFRRHGVGSLLLERSKELILWLLCSENPSFQLLATTPALVESANAFYAANGFSLTASEQVGELRMNTHVAAFP
jgi:GNAT superfamily N-acetyltransferase